MDSISTPGMEQLFWPGGRGRKLIFSPLSLSFFFFSQEIEVQSKQQQHEQHLQQRQGKQRNRRKKRGEKKRKEKKRKRKRKRNLGKELEEGWMSEWEEVRTKSEKKQTKERQNNCRLVMCAWLLGIHSSVTRNAAALAPVRTTHSEKGLTVSFKAIPKKESSPGFVNHKLSQYINIVFSLSKLNFLHRSFAKKVLLLP